MSATELRRPNHILIGTFDQQHPAEHAGGRKRKYQPAAGTQRIEPHFGRLGRTGTHVDQIRLWQIRRKARFGLNIHLWQVFQITARTIRQPFVDLIGVHLTARPNELCEDSRVIPRARADL